jgi:catechol 2,3-dioxygenase-like lactoylglutathione lyase family enzyme
VTAADDAIPPRVSLVTLGVSDLERSGAFYGRLGWERVGDDDGVIFYRMAGAHLALWPLESLADDARVPADRSGFAGVSLAINLADEAEVDAALAVAAAAGATILKPAERVFWGGYSGYFADPDGFVWEVAYNPGWPLDEHGLPQLGQG